MPVWWENQALISKYSKNTGSPMFSWHLQAEAFSSQTMRGRAAHGEDFSAQLGEERKGETVSVFRRWRPWFWMPDVIPTIRFFVSSPVPSAPIYFTRDWFFSQIQNSPPWGQFYAFIPNHQKCNQTEITAAGNLGNSQLTVTSSPSTTAHLVCDHQILGLIYMRTVLETLPWVCQLQTAVKAAKK